MAERFAFYGISSNLIMYLTGPLGESTAAAAANVNIWNGTISFLPLLWAFVADSFLGRFRTIVISSSIYILGFGLLTFSTMIPFHYKDPNQLVSSASQLQVSLFFCALYLVAIGQGGYKPCIKHIDNSFGLYIYPREPKLVLGIRTERGGKKNPFARIGNVFVEAVKNRRQSDLGIDNPKETLLLLTHQSSKQFRFLDRAAISCDLAEIEEAKAVLRLVPIWMTCLTYAIVSAQTATFFTKQGATMERSISPGLVVPPATLQCLINLSIIVFVPIYDRLLVPIARSFTQNPSGITMLQRIGTGIFLSILAMVIAALVETKRLQAAQEDVTIPITVWWLVPQYVIFGVSNVFTLAGLQEFFYDQVPSELRSVGMALNLSIFGVGNFLSSFIISVIDKLTGQSGQTSWFDNDLNQAHLDYFYWLLVCLSSIDKHVKYYMIMLFVYYIKHEMIKCPLPPSTTDGSTGSSIGGWKSARLIIVVEMAEQFAFYGISSNLIMYLTGPLGESTAKAAANVNAWSGTVSFLPLFWCFTADLFLGRFRTILIASSLYILGLGLLTFSAMIPSDGEHPSQLQVVIFFCSLYLIAIGQGGYKPCIKVFGADQLDGNDFKETKAKSSYFNWLMFGSCISMLTTRLISIFIQENLSWSLGFGIPSVSMLLSLLLFLLGTKTYRFSTTRGEKNPFARISHVLMEALKRRRRQPNLDVNETLLLLPGQNLKQFSFLDRAAVSCDLAEIEEAKAVLRLVPIWMTCLVYAIVGAQSHTFFTKQGATMDRSISPGLLVPAATLQCFVSLTIVIFVPIYERLLVPVARSFTQNPSGITMLQRIGTGIFLSILTMVIAALVETKRLHAARDDVTSPISVWWLVPQYVIYGVSDVLTMVGLQEFFYDQVPSELRSVGMALSLSIYGVGNFLSSFMISVIDKVTSRSGQTSWFDNDLNHAHLDYFYWLLAFLSSIGLASYLWFAKSYVYNRPNTF
ncbi:hypothetical protein AALP_AA2G153000 [Arabis alpina]|uniref:Uncharacterized protein n=1 Tax=Arabis alpina TaxID=50452 RepID=A0A087HHN1_ARAAL|nr:hypothetical protein AALP_AA2G153000 [Arabis alpina]